jgi:Baseplate J-like protein
MNDAPICPCDGFTHPEVLFNPPGREAIDYRVGDFITFRRALLQSLARETELTQWRPGAQQDLALQLVEWWAYLADILTFYNERIANESYLGTADLPESVQGLIQILGYRPRPGIGASGVVAALINAPKPFTLPPGFQIQSKPGPGKQPQIFELDVATPIQAPDAIAANPTANPLLLEGNQLLLRGKVNTVNMGDELLLVQKNWPGIASEIAVVTVQAIAAAPNSQGQPNTRVTLTSVPSELASAKAADYRLLKSSQFAQVWQFPTGSTTVVGNGQIHLSTLVRQIRVNDPILLRRSSTQMKAIQVTQYKEIVWYANPKNNNPTSRVDPPDIPIPIPHTQLEFTATLAGDWDSPTARATVLVYYNWQDVGQLIETPALAFSLADPRVVPASPIAFPLGHNQIPILLEDDNNQGLAAQVTAGSPPPILRLTNLAETNLDLKAPLQVLLNLLPVSRGQTVPNEVLGSGDASFAGQEFTLSKSPLTYLLDPESRSGKDYKSTLRIWVNDIEWREVPSFYGQPADDRIFVTREDVEQKTHVLFGDGVNGARLPTGSNNVVATYRYGSGREAPEAGTLTVIAKPYPNLKAIRNPVAVGGGADPDPPEQIRRYAPRSVLTFDRAVSGDDYETIAAQAPGVDRARAYWTWDTPEQRSLVVIYVGDDASAVTAAKTALRNAADPNRPIVVKRAIAIPIRLQLSVEIDSTFAPEPVLAKVQTVLLDADRGLFGLQNTRIGQSIYQSQIYAACLSVPGVVAVHGLLVLKGASFSLDTRFRHDPGEGKFYQLLAANLMLTPEVAR